MANIRTKNASYKVTAVQVAESGKVTIVVRSPSGKARYLTRKDVGAARFYQAVEVFLREKTARTAELAEA
jgi:hypothetical protein